MDTTLVLALVSGIAIAAAAGLRAFLPLLAVGLAGRFGLLPLRPEAEWLAGDIALWALGAATVLELAGDKIPIVDHALDALGTVLRPAAAWIGGFAVLANWGSPWAQIAALVFGAGALAVHAAKAKTRIGSTALTLGLGNPVLSFVEDGAVVTLLVLAVLVPLLALLALVGLTWLVARRLSRRATTRPA